MVVRRGCWIRLSLEGFQHEIGCHILRVPKFYSKASVRIALHWPTVATRTLIRKLNFLSKLLSGSNDTISKRVFSSLAVEDVYESSIVQQCRMLESKLDTCVLAKCLSDTDVVRSSKESILRSDLNILLSASSGQLPSLPPTHHGVDCGMLHWIKLSIEGTRALQILFKELCRPSSCFKCSHAV